MKRILYRLLATIKRHPITIYEECSCMYVSNSEKVPKVRLFTTYYGYTLKKIKSGEDLFDKYGIKTGYEYIFEKKYTLCSWECIVCSPDCHSGNQMGGTHTSRYN